MGGYLKNLDSKNWVNGGMVALNLDGLPPQYRVRSLLLTFSLTGTKSGADTVAGDLLPTLVQNLRLTPYYNLPGLESFRLRHIMNGRIVEDISAIPGSGTSFTAFFQLEIPFRIPSLGQDDGSMPTELLMGKTVECTFNSATALNTGTVTVTGGTVRIAAELIHETNIPMFNNFGYVDQASQSMQLQAGIYPYLFYVLPAGTALTSTDVGTVDLTADGIPILQNVRFDQLVSLWNRDAATAAGSRAELQQSGALFIPLAWLPRKAGGVSKQLAAEKNVTLQITAGSQLGGRLVYCRTQLKDQNTINSIAASIGSPKGVVYEPATASKTPLHAVKPGEAPNRKARLIYSALPGKLRDTPTPGNKAS